MKKFNKIDICWDNLRSWKFFKYNAALPLFFVLLACNNQKQPEKLTDWDKSIIEVKEETNKILMDNLDWNKTYNIIEPRLINLSDLDVLDNKTETFTVTTEDLKDWPFDINKPKITLSFWNLLWEGQTQYILEFNGISWKNQNNIIEKDQTLNIPLIYPELKSEFPRNWNDFLNNKWFEKYKNSPSENHIVVTKCSNGLNALAYYKWWTLTMASFVSIWTTNWHKTPTWEFKVWDKEMKKVSSKYNSAMPYSIHINGDIFLHQWASNWTPRSHGCVRMPWLYERWLYQEMTWETKDNTSIILDKLY